MHRFCSQTARSPAPPYEECTCMEQRVALDYFLQHPEQLEMLRLIQLTNEEMKAVLVADNVNHKIAGHGKYPIGSFVVCVHCFQWLRGLFSLEPMKAASRA